jgi:hypothetical protein
MFWEICIDRRAFSIRPPFTQLAVRSWTMQAQALICGRSTVDLDFPVSAQWPGIFIFT